MSQVSPYIDRFALVVLRFVLELENWRDVHWAYTQVLR